MAGVVILAEIMMFITQGHAMTKDALAALVLTTHILMSRKSKNVAIVIVMVGALIIA